MREIRYTTQFKRDFKRAKKRNEDLRKLHNVISLLAAGDPLALRYRDHTLLGEYTGCRECHIEPDWPLIYEASTTELILIRTGSHSDLFR